MGDFRAITLQSGHFDTVNDVDTLLVGMGVKSTVNALTITGLTSLALKVGGVTVLSSDGTTVSVKSPLAFTNTSTEDPVISWTPLLSATGIKLKSGSTEVARFQDNGQAIFLSFATNGGLQIYDFGVRRGSGDGFVQFDGAGSPGVRIGGAAGSAYTSVLRVEGTTAAVPVVQIKALATTQSANLLELLGVSNTVVASVSVSGVFTGNGSGLSNLVATNLATGTVPTARLGSGTPDSTTFLRGDSTWAVPIGGGGGGTVTSVNLTAPAAGITVSGGPITTTGSITLTLANDLLGLEGLAATGIPARTATDTWAVRTVTGTASRLTVTNGNGVAGNPTLDIDSTYVGQASITTLGTITTGTWTGTTIALANGGTGQINAVNAINALLPAQATNSGRFLTSNGTATSWSAAAPGTVTSVNLTAPLAGITVSGGPVTTSGSITLALANDLAALEGLATTGIAARTAADTWAVRTVTGTTSRLAVTNGDGVAGNPTLDIDSAYVGQASITTLGTITTGTWTGTTIALANGGTGQINAVNAINALLPAQATNSGKYLTTNGTATSWGTVVGGGGGTVTSVNLTAPLAGITVSGGPITVSGSITLALANDLAALEGLATTGIAARTAADTWAVRTITGTASRLTVTNGDAVAGNPTLDIDSTYVGQSSITTLGTITTGTWTGTTIALANGGTGQINAVNAINALLPAQATNSGRFLTSNGTVTSWSAAAPGTVTSINLTAPVAGITVAGGPITASGSITLALANDLAALEGLATTGIAARTAADTWAVRTITGTASRLTVTNGDAVAGNPTLDISAAYVGQASITTLGTITTGTWTGTTIALANGGTGQINAVNAINALLPAQATNSGKYLTTNGTATSWGTVTGGGGAAQGRNILINGNFDIWQRGTPFYAPATSQYTADRWRIRVGGTISTNVSQVISNGSNGPNSQVQNWIMFASNQPTVTEGVGPYGGYGSENLEVLMLTQPLEVRQARRINNKQFTLSFWVRSSIITGNLGVSFLGPGDTMSYYTTVSITAAGVWQQKTVTVSAQALMTTESEFDKGLTVGFVVYPGTGFNSTNTVNTWAAAAGNWYTTAANDFHSSYNSLEIAQVQLEDGAAATSFDYVWPELEKRSCERYYQQVFVAGGMYNGDVMMPATNYVSVPVRTKLRVAPSVTVVSTSMSSIGLSGSPTASASADDNVYVTYIVNSAQNGYFNGLKLLMEADING